MGLIISTLTASVWSQDEPMNPGAGESANDFGRFKHFMAAPPVIEEIKYVHLYPGRTNEYPPVYLSAKWQTNGFLQIKSERQQDIFETNREKATATGHFGSNWWMAYPRQLTMWTATGEAGDKTNIVRTTVEASLKQFADLLNMGVEREPIGAIRWSGNRFTSTVHESDTTWVTAGELAPDEFHRAGQLDLLLTNYTTTASDATRFHWRVHYGYEPNRPISFLPSTITTEAILEGGEPQILDEFKILDVALGTNLQPEETFSASNFVRPRMQINVAIDNNRQWVVQPLRMNPFSLRNKPLPDLAAVNLPPAASPPGVAVLLCLFNVGQPASRQAVQQLNQRAAELWRKNIVVSGVQAVVISDDAFNEWKKTNPVTLPLGRVEQNTDNSNWATQAPSFPWLILTDANHKVVSEGFSLDALDAQIQKLSLTPVGSVR